MQSDRTLRLTLVAALLTFGFSLGRMTLVHLPVWS